MIPRCLRLGLEVGCQKLHTVFLNALKQHCTESGIFVRFWRPPPGVRQPALRFLHSNCRPLLMLNGQTTIEAALSCSVQKHLHGTRQYIFSMIQLFWCQMCIFLKRLFTRMHLMSSRSRDGGRDVGRQAQTGLHHRADTVLLRRRPGDVRWQNRLFELLQVKKQTNKKRKHPLLLSDTPGTYCR